MARYLSTGQAAARCSVSPDTVLKWIRSGLLPSRRTVGGHNRIAETDLEKLLDDATAPSDRSDSPLRRRWISVLVVTDDPDATQRLKEAESEANFNLELADCEYTCSAVIHEFRPDIVVVDCSLGRQSSGDITDHLIADPRVPLVRVVLAGDEDQFPTENEEVVFARLQRGYGVRDINECIEGIQPYQQDVSAQS